MSSKILSTHTDVAIDSTARFRMNGQNRTRYLNSMARAKQITTGQSIPASTQTFLTFNSDDFDTDGIHDTGSNTDRFTVALTGKYLVVGGLDLLDDGNDDGTIVFLRITKNGATGAGSGLAETRQKPITTSSDTLVVSAILSLTAGDYIGFLAFHNDTAARTTDINNANCFGSIAYLGE
jgi:hypothetical protein